jgi:hypothetical protein
MGGLCQAPTTTLWRSVIVVKGAQESIRRFDTIVVKCQDVPSSDDSRLHRKGGAYYNQVKEYLCERHSFCGSSFDQIAEEDMFGNAMFWKAKSSEQQKPKPPIRLTPVLSDSAMKERYEGLARRVPDLFTNKDNLEFPE